MTQKYWSLPVTAGAAVRTRVSTCGICGGQSGTDRGFCPRISVLPVSTVAPLLSTHSAIYHWFYTISAIDTFLNERNYQQTIFNVLFYTSAIFGIRSKVARVWLPSEATSPVMYVSVTEYSELSDKPTVAQLLNKPPHFCENQ